MKVENKSKQVLHINHKDSKGVIMMASVPVGESYEHDFLTEADVSIYVKKDKMKIVEAGSKAGKKASSSTNNEVVLPEEPTLENLIDLKITKLKKYCKQEGLEGYEDKSLEELAQFILDSLVK